jgi:8-oxo-dGTP diphosphatase
LLEEQPDHDVVRPTCPECEFIVYYNPAPAVGGVITSGDKILLVKRAYPPKAGLWSLPAGFMEFGERQLDALAREVREETGIETLSATLLSVEDASDDPRTHALLIAFIIDEWQGEPRAGDDAAEAAWWPISTPPQMAWRNHVRVIEKARKWLNL